MKKQFETTLTGPDSPIDGIADQLNDDGSAWEFKSIDGSLHLVIAKDEDGNWQRIEGTEPYLSSWIDELAEKIGE
ncbi:hypothetical protein [Mucilaginibacter gotjawali]|uniref:Uncharacterized protein n=2 Tax=Mucilaginibacter gotjawali TaxID=1550579 RepID=A0A839S858_9SPHI|nr:hypothetical protein [Mucilaginibacter gotjawali]MBB3054115.1 hypothetical protein [Mucilaginibacter gotjawali]BAU54384.1 hypothetical protein MgSA37_02560 [Mucilaginibacter gotjawali]